MEEKVSKIGMLNVATFELDDDQHDIVCCMAAQDKTKQGNYSNELVDEYTIDAWIADELDNANFCKKYKDKFADIYTLYDHLGNYKQPIGEVAIW